MSEKLVGHRPDTRRGHVALRCSPFGCVAGNMFDQTLKCRTTLGAGVLPHLPVGTDLDARRDDAALELR